MLFEQLVATSGTVAATTARSAKTAALATLLAGLAADEIEPAVAWLSGEPRQGKVGVGWATVFSVIVDQAAEPSLTIADVDGAIDALARSEGPGSAAARQAGVARLLARATPDEAEFLRRLLVGELRQGALAGVMADAVARASGCPCRRCAGPPCSAVTCRGWPVWPSLTDRAVWTRVGLTLLRPVSPMLASPSAGVIEAIEALGRSSVEWKLDGARIQAHRRGDEVRLFTRNGNDVTGRLPAVEAIMRGSAGRSSRA